MRLLALACSAALVGCATEPKPLPVLTPDIAQQMSAADLCLGLSTFRPGNASVAQQEVYRRGINCNDHAAAIQALQQARAQREAVILQNSLNRPAYQPYQVNPYQIPTPQMPRQTNCTSYRVGNTVQTDCR